MAPAMPSQLAMGEGILFREACKRAVPQIIHVVRFGRMLLNQIKFPVVGAILDWQGKVQDGPFKGIRHARSGCAVYGVLLGTYELSLAEIVEQVVAKRPDLIIDVGAAAGYYALGFAWRCPTAKVVAYEMDPTRRDLLQKYIRINGLTDRIDARGLCTEETLKANISGQVGAFLLMDVEGAEDCLLKPNIPNMDRTEILVELHEMFVPGITQRLQERFVATHRTFLIEEADLKSHRPSSELEKTIGPLGMLMWRRLIREHRGHSMTWMHMVPKKVYRNPSTICVPGTNRYQS
jgi:hypothetical protein